MRAPRVAIATGDGVSSNDFGELWYLFERELEYPFTPLDARSLPGVDLLSYDVIILPDGFRWSSIIDSSFGQSLRSWVQKGGTLIALEEASRALARSRSGISPATLVTDEKKEDAEKKQEEERKKRLAQLTRFEQDEVERLESIPGAIFRVQVDTTHPVGFGFDGPLYVLKGNASPFTTDPETGHVVARFSPDTVAVSGYAHSRRAKQVAGAPYARVYRHGPGSVVLLPESVTFRMFWRGPMRLLLNSILYLPRPERSVGPRIH
jgi:hypothetical protein